MDCREAREGLWPPERPRLVGDDIAAARRHVDDCGECRDYFEQDRALLEFYDRIRDQPAPLEVRESVFEALSRARWRDADHSGAAAAKSSTLWRLGAWPVALTAALLVVFMVEMRPKTAAPADDPTVFVEDYLRRAVGQDHIETSDPAEVRRFLQRELGMQLQPLAFAGLALERAEICLLEGRRGAMIVYKKDGAEISHYLIPRDGTGPRTPSVSAYSSGTAGGEMPVVTWSTPRVEQALVGELTSEQLLDMARRGSSDE